jgi:predicted N-acyltransferase
LLDALLAMTRRSGLSSLHVLFPSDDETALLAQAGMVLRRGLQFHWQNDGWADFDAFLASLSRDKRKKIRQERRRVADAGVRLLRLTGDAITAADWSFFAACYSNTYALRGREPYLTLEFFERLGAAMPANLLLVLAERDGRRIAASLCLFDRDRLYGRYWGAVEEVPCLHFEACYYQPMEFCLERGLSVFEGGAQGEHKLARGFLPVETVSAHWLADRRFHEAVARFLVREEHAVAAYREELAAHSPFKEGRPC